MRIHCSRCGKSVSNEIPNDTIIRAWIECPECIEGKAKEQKEEPVMKVMISQDSLGDIIYMIGERSGLAPLEYIGCLVASVFAIAHTLPDNEKGHVLTYVDKAREIFMIKGNIVEDKKGTVQ